MIKSKFFSKAYLKQLPLGLIAMLLLLMASIYVFGIIIHEVFMEQEEELDHYVLTFFSKHLMHSRLTDLMKVITLFAESYVLQIGYALLAGLYLSRKNWNRAIEIVSVGIGGFIMNYFMKVTFQRDRPSNPLIEGSLNFSFPSGHATSSFIFYGLIAYLVWESAISIRYKMLLAFMLVSFSLLIGFSRVYLRVHYPTDVLAGFCTGFAWLLICLSLFQFLKKKTNATTRG